MRVFKNQFGKWNTLCKNRMENGEEAKYYLPVRFKRGFEPTQDSIDIEPVNWWHSAYLNKDGEARPLLFISEWRPEKRELEQKNKGGFEYEKSEGLNLQPGDLPFY